MDCTTKQEPNDTAEERKLKGILWVAEMALIQRGTDPVLLRFLRGELRDSDRGGTA